MKITLLFVSIFLLDQIFAYANACDSLTKIIANEQGASVQHRNNKISYDRQNSIFRVELAHRAQVILHDQWLHDRFEILCQNCQLAANRGSDMYALELQFHDDGSFSSHYFQIRANGVSQCEKKVGRTSIEAGCDLNVLVRLASRFAENSQSSA